MTNLYVTNETVTNLTVVNLTVTTVNVTNITVDNFYTDLFVIQYVVTVISNITYNNFNVVGQSKLALDPSGAGAVITGFDGGGVNGQVLYILNVSAYPIKLTDNDSGSLAGNRIYCPWGVYYLLQPGREIQLEYDLTTGVWRFATPTMAVGTAGSPNVILTDGCDLILAGTNVTFTDNMDGSATISASGVTGPTGPTGPTGTDGTGRFHANLRGNSPVIAIYGYGDIRRSNRDGCEPCRGRHVSVDGDGLLECHGDERCGWRVGDLV